MNEALDNLREFVNNHLDGSTSRFLELDQLVWEARLAWGHKPQMYHLDERARGPSSSDGFSHESAHKTSQRGTAELLADLGL